MFAIRNRDCALAALLAAIATFILMTGIAPIASSATSARPWIKFALVNSHVSAGNQIAGTITYSVLPAGTRVFIERSTGPSESPQEVVRLGAMGSGTRIVKLHGQFAGKYRFAAIATGKNGKQISRSAWQQLFSYSDVPLSILCLDPGATIGGNWCQGGNVQVGPNLFAYAIEGNVDYNKPPSYGIIINFPANTCRSMSLSIAMDSNGSQPGDTATVQVIQETTGPQTMTVEQGVVNTFPVNLDGGPFYVENASTANDYLFYNGSANCWSRNGV
jgi:hypothetical protein